jgi:hypothetical protein
VAVAVAVAVGMEVLWVPVQVGRLPPAGQGRKGHGTESVGARCPDRHQRVNGCSTPGKRFANSASSDRGRARYEFLSVYEPSGAGVRVSEPQLPSPTSRPSGPSNSGRCRPHGLAEHGQLIAEAGCALADHLPVAVRLGPGDLNGPTAVRDQSDLVSELSDGSHLANGRSWVRACPR